MPKTSYNLHFCLGLAGIFIYSFRDLIREVLVKGFRIIFIYISCLCIFFFFLFFSGRFPRFTIFNIVGSHHSHGGLFKYFVTSFSLLYSEYALMLKKIAICICTYILF